MLSNAKIPIVGFAGYSGSGKTTLLTRLIVLLRDDGTRVGVIKHAHHRFDIDQPGKDTYRLRAAGAGQVLLGSRYRLALMMEHDDPGDEPDLNGMLAMLDQTRIELVLVEGFKHENFPKIEVHRPATGKPLVFPDDPSIIALASDAPRDAFPALPPDMPLLDINQPEQVHHFIHQHILKTTTP